MTPSRATRTAAGASRRRYSRGSGGCWPIRSCRCAWCRRAATRSIRSRNAAMPSLPACSGRTTRAAMTGRGARERPRSIPQAVGLARRADHRAAGRALRGLQGDRAVQGRARDRDDAARARGGGAGAVSRASRRAGAAGGLRGRPVRAADRGDVQDGGRADGTDGAGRAGIRADRALVLLRLVLVVLIVVVLIVVAVVILAGRVERGAGM